MCARDLDHVCQDNASFNFLYMLLFTLHLDKCYNTSQFLGIWNLMLKQPERVRESQREREEKEKEKRRKRFLNQFKHSPQHAIYYMTWILRIATCSYSMEIALEIFVVEEQKNIGIWSSMTLIFCDKCTWLCPKHVFICIFQAVQIDLAGL